MGIKIGIITLSASNNCGSMLQCYALKKLFEEYGDVEVINFSSEASHRMYDIFPTNIIKHPRQVLKRLFQVHYLMKEKKAYQTFRKKMIGIKGKELLAKDLIAVANKYDIVVTGSDQVWNVKMADFDEAFFAYWTKCKKVAYAPSLGGYDIRESKNSKMIIKWLNDFSALSVRECQGKKCLEEVTGKKVDVILDPTLVIKKEKWIELIGEPIVKGDYIFFYSWAYCYEPLLKIVSDCGNRDKMPVYVIDSRKWICNKAKNWNFRLCSKEGPIAFLNLMYYAKRCYVESFHGMVFAYLFKKDFWLLDIHKTFEEVDTRLKELIVLIEAQDRILTEYNVDTVNQSEPIKYKENDNLEELREKSLTYIREAMR